MAPWAEPENPDDGLTCRIGPRQSSATSNGREIYGKHIQNHFIGFTCNRAVVLVAGAFGAEILRACAQALLRGSRRQAGLGGRTECAGRDGGRPVSRPRRRSAGGVAGGRPPPE